MPLKNIFVDIGSRLFVGVIFLVAGISKLPMHAEFIDVVVAYKILPSYLAYLYASALPWLEITIGSCLILGLFTRLFSLVSLPIIISFIVANVIGLSIDPVGRCLNCLGWLIETSYVEALVIDALLLVGASLILFQRKRFMALDSPLSRLFKFNWFI